MRIAVLVENWGEPWNEGYKNLAKYIIEMLRNSVDIYPIPANIVEIPLLEKFDVIHVFNYKIPFHQLSLFARLKGTIVKHVAKKELDINIKSYLKSLLNVKFIWDAITVTTEMLKEEVVRLARDKPVFHLPPPIPVDYFKRISNSRELLGLEKDKIYIGYTGALNEFRDLKVIFEALKIVDSKDVKIILSVSNANRGKLVELKRLLAVSDVKFINSLKDVRLFYSSVDLLVYPVKREGAVEPPLTVLEAMSCESIVAAYKNPVTSKLILDGYNGFLFSGVNDLAEIINMLKSGRLDREAVGRKARKTIIENYSASKLSRLYMEVYRQLASTHQ